MIEFYIFFIQICEKKVGRKYNFYVYITQKIYPLSFDDVYGDWKKDGILFLKK